MNNFGGDARTSPLEAATGDIETSKRQRLDLEATQTPKNTEKQIGQSFVLPEREKRRVRGRLTTQGVGN